MIENNNTQYENGSNTIARIGFLLALVLFIFPWYYEPIVTIIIQIIIIISFLLLVIGFFITPRGIAILGILLLIVKLAMIIVEFPGI